MITTDSILLNMKEIGLNLIEVTKIPLSWALGIFAYFTPISGVFYLILLVISFDFATGLRASFVKKVPRNSKRLRKSVEKMMCYLGVIWLFWEFEIRLNIEEHVKAHNFIAGFIFLVEVISILENMAVITENPIFIKIVKLIRGKSAEKHGSIIEDILSEKNETDKK